MKISRSMITRMAKLFREGWTQHSVCAKVGVSRVTFLKWGNLGTKLLEDNDNDKTATIKYIKREFPERDHKMMTLCVEFVVTIYEAMGEQVGLVEEVAYRGALDDANLAMKWLGVRAPNDWAKKAAPLVSIESHPIKQIIMHKTPESKQITDGNTEDAVYIEESAEITDDGV